MGTKDRSKEVWASGDAYEPYVGRWSRLVAQEFVHWLGLYEGSQWLDVGCGTGALSQTILKLAIPKEVKGIDRSERFVEFARKQVIPILSLRWEMHKRYQSSPSLTMLQSLA